MILATAFLAILGPQLTRLPNGIPVVVDSTGEPTVTIQVLIDVADLGPLELGAAETMAGALFGETENYSLRELQRLAWSIGGSVVSESAGDCLRLEVTTTRDRLRPAAAFISDALRRPVFSVDALTYARQSEAYRQSWLDRTPPLRDIRTSLAANGIAGNNVAGLTQQQAVALHSMVVRPERVAIGVVGGTTSDEVATVLGSSLGHWRGSEAAQGISGVRHDIRDTGGFKTALHTVRGPLPNSAGFAAWMAACIGFGEGKQGRLNRTFRVQQSAYVLGSYFSFRANASYCTFYVSTTNGVSRDDLKAAAIDFQPTEDEAKRAKAFLIGRYRVGGPAESGRFGAFSVGHETDSARAFWLAWWELRGAGIGKDEGFIAEVDALSQEQIAAAARTFRPD